MNNPHNLPQSDDKHERLHADMREMLRNYKAQEHESYVEQLENAVDALRNDNEELKALDRIQSLFVFVIGIFVGYIVWAIFQ